MIEGRAKVYSDRQIVFEHMAGVNIEGELVVKGAA